MIELTIAIVLVVALLMLEIMDRYSTETLLNLEVLWHEDKDYREKVEEDRLKQHPLNSEKNLWVRAIIKKYGIHKGLTLASGIAFVFIGYLSGAIIYGVTTQHLALQHLTMYAMVTFFFLGLIFKQFLEAITRKRRWRKIMK